MEILTTLELEREHAAVLPARQVLGVYNWLGLNATNVAAAINTGTGFSLAQAFAGQAIVVSQH